jgi:hypothetical protein
LPLRECVGVVYESETLSTFRCCLHLFWLAHFFTSSGFSDSCYNFGPWTNEKSDNGAHGPETRGPPRFHAHFCIKENKKKQTCEKWETDANFLRFGLPNSFTRK